MELELKRETREGYAPGGEYMLSREETAETIVPDYCPDAERIVESGGAVFVESREVRDGRAEVRGTIRVHVLYLPDGERDVRTLEFDMPFSVEGDGPEDAEGLVLWAEAEPEFLETRLLNPRKLLTRCKLAVRLTTWQKMPLVYATDVEDGEKLSLEKRRERRHAVALAEAVETEFTFSDELELSPGRPGAAELLSWRVTPSVTEAKILGNKLIAKGIFTVSLLYLTEGDGCRSAVGELPFSQILELSAEQEDARASVQVQMTGEDVQISGGDPDGRLISVTLYLRALGLVRREEEIVLLSDLYSTAYDVSCQCVPLDLDARHDRQVLRTQIRELLEIGVEADTVLSLSAVCGGVTVSREGESAVLRTPVTVRALYLDGDGVPLAAERRIEAGCPIELPEGGQLSVRAVCPEEVQGSLGERGIEVRFPVDFQAEIRVPCQALCVSEASLDREVPREGGPSLVLRRVGPEETAWDIAKAYRTTIRELFAANQIPEDGDLPRDELLLIPRRRA
ncbi:MAG: DUF3794 domain-containing protein [Oscillibacter sp.]|nr:DUF3794 domain-containing protein [Oscillibacter sp.]